VRTTEIPSAALDAVPDNAASAMLTPRRHAFDRALKRVEHVHRAVGVHLERRPVIVTADFTYGHERVPLPPAPIRRHQHPSPAAAPVSLPTHVVCDGEPPIQTRPTLPKNRKSDKLPPAQHGFLGSPAPGTFCHDFAELETRSVGYALAITSIWPAARRIVAGRSTRCLVPRCGPSVRIKGHP